MTTRVLVTVAHPDDETFGTGSVIAAAVERGAEVTVCCATRGEAGEAPGLDPGCDLGAVREAELRAAGEVLGVSRCLVLGYGDSGMTGEPQPGSLAAAPFPDVVSDVRQVLRDVEPHVVVTLDPDHGDGHRDHERIGRATIEACRELADVRLYIWAVDQALMARWFAALADVRPNSTHLELDLEAPGRPGHHITTVLDVAHLRSTRERAMAMHRSQTSPYAGMPEDLRAAFLETDRLVRLQPPWPGGQLERTLF
ncbi:MAG TPA: PIG-L deacetylase family protein [Jatrophihabitans sp.]|nr:PIG-L deacetylase family protein [Jatrophihabitans sp.]